MEVIIKSNAIAHNQKSIKASIIIAYKVNVMSYDS